MALVFAEVEKQSCIIAAFVLVVLLDLTLRSGVRGTGAVYFHTPFFWC